MTLGFVGADLENLVNEAAILAARRNLTILVSWNFRMRWSVSSPGRSARAKS
ncbi:MAG: hypothetical protein U0401_19290 [Anaerolineae bacterium]